MPDGSDTENRNRANEGQHTGNPSENGQNVHGHIGERNHQRRWFGRSHSGSGERNFRTKERNRTHENCKSENGIIREDNVGDGRRFWLWYFLIRAQLNF